MRNRATMLGHHVYRVHPEGEEWAVIKEGEDCARANFDDREQAIAEAMRLARSDQPAKVRIDNGDGSIAEERLIGRDSSDELQP
jgi:hypothetical protein